MKTFYEHTGKLAEHLILEAPEEFIILMRALDLYAVCTPGAPPCTSTGQERAERQNVYIDSVRRRCETLRLDMESGFARAQKGYPSLEFNGEDTELLSDALYYLAAQEKNREPYAAYAVAARYLIRTEITEGFAADVSQGLSAAC